MQMSWLHPVSDPMTNIVVISPHHGACRALPGDKCPEALPRVRHAPRRAIQCLHGTARRASCFQAHVQYGAALPVQLREVSMSWPVLTFSLSCHLLCRESWMWIVADDGDFGTGMRLTGRTRVRSQTLSIMGRCCRKPWHRRAASGLFSRQCELLTTLSTCRDPRSVDSKREVISSEPQVKTVSREAMSVLGGQMDAFTERSAFAA